MDFIDNIFILGVFIAFILMVLVILGVLADKHVEPWLDKHRPWEDAEEQAERDRDEETEMMAEFQDLPESLKKQAE